MANPEHLKILKQGVKVWNRWRKENPSIRADLSKSNLSFMNLSGGNFTFVNLNDANLTSVNLARANIREAKLRESHLVKANLQGANLREVWLKNANLSYANLSDADLLMACLFEAVLSGADLGRADLSSADLFEANFRAARLIGAKLVGADLGRADFFAANLERANLARADLRACVLVRSNLTGATLTGANLYGTARDDWIIRDIQCQHIYWDEEGNQRYPRDRDFEPGEFERLYTALPTIEYIFEHGMSPIDPLIMDRVVQAIRERQSEFDIKIDSLNARGLAPSIRFTVKHEEHKEPALAEVRKEYEIKLRQLESERDRYYDLLAHALDAPKEVKLINAAPGSIVATDGSTVSVEQHIYNALELQKVIAEEPDESESFAKVAKKMALDIIGDAIKDVAKGQVKEAAKQIVELGKDLGPVITKTAAYVFFKSIGA